MSRRKWAWDSYEEGSDTDAIDVERAVVSDFTDWVAEEIERVQEIAERTENPQVVLGLELALDVMRQTAEAWMGRGA